MHNDSKNRGKVKRVLLIFNIKLICLFIMFRIFCNCNFIIYRQLSFIWNVNYLLIYLLHAVVKVLQVLHCWQHPSVLVKLRWGFSSYLICEWLLHCSCPVFWKASGRLGEKNEKNSISPKRNSFLWGKLRIWYLQSLDSRFSLSSCKMNK